MEDDDEPTLPTMPRLVTGRKRPFHLNTTFTEPVYSSDLGVFSSDDDPGLDNYSQGRNKRRYKGAWYDHSQEQTIPEEDEDFTTPRKPISQPFTGGDDHHNAPPSSGSTLTTWAHTSPPSSSQKTGALPSWTQMSPSSSQKPSLPVSSTNLTQMKLVQEVIEKIDFCIDHGKENIDLSDQQLKDDHIAPETFDRLGKLKLVPRLDLALDHPDEDRYLHCHSPIHLFLAKNQLTRLPGTIGAIEHLVTLSLRNNEMTELPPALGQCRNLMELNVAYNKLRSIPFEVIELMCSKTQVEFMSNNYYRLDEESLGAVITAAISLPSPSAEMLSLGSWRRKPWYLGRGAVQFTDTAGRPYSKFTVPTATTGKETQIALSTEPIMPTTVSQGQQRGAWPLQRSEQPTRVPSLVEICARSLLRVGHVEPHLDVTNEADLISTTFAAVAKTKYQGSQRCAICEEPFVIPRTQWIEFYCSARADADSNVPYFSYRDTRFGADFFRTRLKANIFSSLRKGCSWKCVPYGREPKMWSVVPRRDEREGLEADCQ